MALGGRSQNILEAELRDVWLGVALPIRNQTETHTPFPQTMAKSLWGVRRFRGPKWLCLSSMSKRKWERSGPSLSLLCEVHSLLTGLTVEQAFLFPL